MKHVVLAWQCFQKLTDARGAFTHTPCVYVQIDSNSGQVGRGRGLDDWFLHVHRQTSDQHSRSDRYLRLPRTRHRASVAQSGRS